MAKITYVQPDGLRREFDLPDGWSAMDGAVQYDVIGILAACCGKCDCATCHVYVDARSLGMLPTPTKEELDALRVVASPRLPNSRLACQIVLRPELSGIVLEIPTRQL